MDVFGLILAPLVHPVDAVRKWWGEYQGLLQRARLLIEKDERAAEIAAGGSSAKANPQTRRQKLLSWRLSPFEAIKELRNTMQDPQSKRLITETYKRTPLLLLSLVLATTLVNSYIVLETVRVRGSIFDSLMMATGISDKMAAAAGNDSHSSGIAGAGEQAMSTVVAVLVRLFLLRIAEEVFDIVSIVLTENLREELEHRARVAFFEGVLSQSLAFVDGHTGAELAQHITAAPLALYDVALIPVRILRYSSTFAGGLYSMMTLDWKLTAAAFLLRAPVTLNLSAYTHRLLALHYRVADDLVSRSSNFMNECLSQIRLIQVHTAEHEETRKYAGFLAEGKKTSATLRVVEKVVARTTSFLNLLIELGTLSIAAQRILAGALTIGGFHSFKSYQYSTSIAFESLLHEAGRLKNTARKCGVFFAVLDAHEERQKTHQLQQQQQEQKKTLKRKHEEEEVLLDGPEGKEGLRNRKGKGTLTGSSNGVGNGIKSDDDDATDGGIHGPIVFKDVWFRYPTTRGPSSSSNGAPPTTGDVDLLGFIAAPATPVTIAAGTDAKDGNKEGLAATEDGTADKAAPGQRVYSLRGTSFSVDPGSYTVLVGFTGSGKTSCLRLLLRLYDATKGSITIRGRSITEYSLHELRRHIAFVDQEATLLNRSLLENLTLGIPEEERPSQEEIERVCKDACILDTIRSFPYGFETVVGDRGLKLSSGERARIAIARAFLRKPSIVLADESTANLDALSELAVREGLRNLQKGGATLIMIAHRLSMAAQADKVVVIEDGQCVESGTVAELVSRPGSRFSQLVAAQTLGIEAAAAEASGSLDGSATSTTIASPPCAPAAFASGPLLAGIPGAVSSRN